LGKIRPCFTRADEMLAETVPQTSDPQQASYIQIVYYYYSWVVIPFSCESEEPLETMIVYFEKVDYEKL
jgi:hypothetical protein